MIEQYEKSISLLECRLSELRKSKGLLCSLDYKQRVSLLECELDDLYLILNYLKGVSPILRLGNESSIIQNTPYRRVVSSALNASR